MPGGQCSHNHESCPSFWPAETQCLFCSGFSGHGVAVTGLAGTLMAECVAATSERFAIFDKVPHMSFPGGRLLRTPALVLAMSYYRVRDLL